MNRNLSRGQFADLYARAPEEPEGTPHEIPLLDKVIVSVNDLQHPSGRRNVTDWDYPQGSGLHRNKDDAYWSALHRKRT